MEAAPPDAGSFGPDFKNWLGWVQAQILRLEREVEGKADRAYVDSGLEPKLDAACFHSTLGSLADRQYVDLGLAAKADAEYLERRLGEKADVTVMGRALAEKADAAGVSRALAEKADAAAVKEALAEKADAAFVSRALEEKADAAAVKKALAEKADTSGMDAALREKADGSYIDAQLALKAARSDLEAALRAKVGWADLDSRLQEKANEAHVVAELEAKAEKHYVDLRFQEKADVAYVDAALCAKADRPRLDEKVNATLAAPSGSSALPCAEPDAEFDERPRALTRRIPRKSPPSSTRTATPAGAGPAPAAAASPRAHARPRWARMNVDLALVKEHAGKPLSTVRRLPPSALQGLPERSDPALGRLHLTTIGQLGAWPPYLKARALRELAALEAGGRRCRAGPNVDRALVEAHRGKALKKLLRLPPSAFRGLEGVTDGILGKLHIGTIGRLGRWRPAEWASAIAALAERETKGREQRGQPLRATKAAPKGRPGKRARVEERQAEPLEDLAMPAGRTSQAMNVDRAVCGAARGSSLRELQKMPPSVLRGLPEGSARALRALRLGSVRQLGTWKYFRWARAICELASHEEQRAGAANADRALNKEHEGRSFGALLALPPSALWGIGVQGEAALGEAGVSTVKELGSWRFAEWANAVRTLAGREGQDAAAK